MQMCVSPEFQNPCEILGLHFSDSAGKIETFTKEAFFFLAWEIDSDVYLAPWNFLPHPSYQQNMPHLLQLVSSSPPSGSLSWSLPHVNLGTRAVQSVP